MKSAGNGCRTSRPGRFHALLRRLLIAALVAALPATPGRAADPAPVRPKAKDRCPVCGMFVAKYPDFVAEVVYSDGGYAVFDGAKDLFKYLWHLRKYAPSRQASDVRAVYVTDYYSLQLIDGRKAWYVTGSDVYGPMGHELIPFAVEAEAKEFLADHKGKRLLRFEEVTPAVVSELDE